MKLYATIKSERASKGQGGNNFLEIEIKVQDRDTPIGVIYLDYHNDSKEHGDEMDEWVLSWRSAKMIDPDIIAQGHVKRAIKGKKQKDEKCKACGESNGRHSDDACQPYKGTE